MKIVDIAYYRMLSSSEKGSASLMAAAQTLPFPGESDLPFEDVSDFPFEDCYKSQTEDDSHIVVRETPRWKVRQNWAFLKLRRHELLLQKELDLLHAAEHEVEDSTPAPRRTGWLERLKNLLDIIAVLICRTAHPPAEFQRGRSYSQCPSCGRKYALPWADPATLDRDVYVCSE